VTRFVVLSTQRSGSTWVVDMLNSHARVVAYAELFMHGGRGRPRWGGATDLPFWQTFLAQNGTSRSRLLRSYWLWRYLGRVYARRPGIDAAGFKLMYSQLDAARPLLPALVARRVVVIHLVRRNALDVLVSRHSAAARGTHHARERVDPVRVHLPAKDLVSRISEHERSVETARRLLARVRLPCREVAYEDLVADRDRQFALLFSFLGTDPAAPTSALTKLNPASHRELIENYDEVRSALAETPYASLVR
jgi:LPS sulfotransferase NodH